MYPEESVNARPWTRSRPPRRILAIRLQAFGDTVLTLPYLSALRRSLPATPVDFLTRTEVATVPRALTLFDRVFAIGGGRSPWRQYMRALALVPRLRLRRYEVVVDLQRNRVSRLVRRTLAVPCWSEFDRFSPRLAGERTRRTIEALGLGALRVYPDLRAASPGAGLAKLLAAGWDEPCELVVLNPAGAFPARNWPVASYVEFCRRWIALRRRPTQFLLLGLDRIAERAAAIRAAVGDAVLNIVGKDTADEAFEMLGRAILVVSEDSGLMHLSWVAGVPTLGLFGASRWVWAAPHGNYSALVRTCREADGVCMAGSCHRGDPPCIARLTPEAAVDAGRRLLDRVARVPKMIHPT
jgi:ADP-heptose:LPS heptosyltransferase